MTDLPELPSELVEAAREAWFQLIGGRDRDEIESMIRALLNVRGPSGRLLYLASELEQVGYQKVTAPGQLCDCDGEHPAADWVPVFRLPQDQP